MLRNFKTTSNNCDIVQTNIKIYPGVLDILVKAG